MFTYPMAVKSVITRPSPGLGPGRPGLYEVSGLAWSGNGKITAVDVSADGGRTWAEATLGEPVLPRAVTRFRIPWKWEGRPSVLKSRARDSTGDVQPTRERLIAEHGANVIFHYNAIQAWHIAANGEVKNIYA
jgi:sulfane dehydrogenase subunit SoxC